MKPPRTIAVTGATGFVGRAVVRALRERFPAVRLRMLVRPKAGDSTSGSSATSERVPGDLRDETSLEELVRGADTVVHLASPSPKSDGPTLHEVNVRGTRVLARAAAKAGADRFIYMGSASVYGAPHRGDDWQENAPTIPYHDYGRTKLGGESAATAAFMELPDAEPDASIVMSPISEDTATRAIVVLRPTAVYGAGDYYLQSLAAGLRRSPTYYYGGDEWTNPVFVDDLASITATAVERAAPGALVVNVGGPDRVLLEDLRDQVAAHAGLPRGRRALPRWLAGPVAAWSTRTELPAYRAVLLSKARGETFNGCVAIDRLSSRFAPRLTPLADGLRRAFEKKGS